MPDETNEKSPIDPMELWEQWYSSATNAWSNAMNGGKERYMDPFGLYQGWLKSMSEVQERLLANPTGLMDANQAWKLWFQAMTDGWRKAAELGGDPLGLMTSWLEMMEEMRTKLQASEGVPNDPFTFFKQWYDATNETWAKAVGEFIGTDRFMQGVRQSLENYSSFTRTFRHSSEEYLKTLQLPTRSDLARVAELVVNLEEKVDRIDDAFEEIEEGQTKVATGEAVANLEGRLEAVEDKLNTFPTILKKVEAVEGLAKRLDQLEDKIDKVLVALKKIEVKEQAEASKPAKTSTRKATKKNDNQQKVQDSK
jgi:polyhydroxyalkanoic acid synthase PhaR subunit